MHWNLLYSDRGRFLSLQVTIAGGLIKVDFKIHYSAIIVASTFTGTILIQLMGKVPLEHALPWQLSVP